MSSNNFIPGLVIGIIIGIIITILIMKVKEVMLAPEVFTSIIGRWKMPDDIAAIEPLKASFIDISNDNEGYVIIQGIQRTKLSNDNNVFTPISTGAPIVGITFEYNEKDDTLIQEIAGHPFIYTRVIVPKTP